jgi:hypothetical protein
MLDWVLGCSGVEYCWYWGLVVNNGELEKHVGPYVMHSSLLVPG